MFVLLYAGLAAVVAAIRSNVRARQVSRSRSPRQNLRPHVCYDPQLAVSGCHNCYCLVLACRCMSVLVAALSNVNRASLFKQHM